MSVYKFSPYINYHSCEREKKEKEEEKNYSVCVYIYIYIHTCLFTIENLPPLDYRRAQYPPHVTNEFYKSLTAKKIDQ
jgi:hypothetical protein